jgi:hypothetical protein
MGAGRKIGRGFQRTGHAALEAFLLWAASGAVRIGDVAINAAQALKRLAEKAGRRA